MRSLAQDLKFAIRNLLHNPLFAATAILSLALGIGAGTGIFTLTNQILLKMVPVRQPDRLVALHWAGEFIGGSSRGWNDSFSYLTYADLRASSEAFTGIAARYQDQVDVAGNGVAERATAELVSGNYFDVLEVTPALGRLLTPKEDRVKGGEPFVVVSFDYWQRRFGGDASALNRTIDVNGRALTIVGVAQRDFGGLDLLHPADLFVPLSMKTVVTPTWDDMNRRDNIWLRVFARLRPGIGVPAAENSLAGPYRAALERDLAAVPRSARFSAQYLRNRLHLASASQGFGGAREFFFQPLYILLSMVGVLLLIACANVANLLITRAQGRQREISIRLALGATRGSLMQLILMESLLIAAASGALGLLLSEWITSLLVALLPSGNIGAAIHPSPDGRVLVFTAGLSLLTALLAGVAPAFEATRPTRDRALHNDSRSTTLSRPRTRLRRVLIFAQVALSFLLLSGAGLFALSFYRLMQVQSGMAVSHLLEFSVDPSMHSYTPQRSRRVYLDIAAALARIPGVQAASGLSVPVLAGNTWQNTVHIEGYRPSGGEDMNPGWNEMLPGFFAAAGVPLLAGRDFNDRDVAGAPPVTIVNETFQKRFFPRTSPLGHRIGFGDTGPTDMEIVGVVRDMKGEDMREQPRAYNFTPVLQNKAPGPITFYIRTLRDPVAVAPAARRAVQRPGCIAASLRP